jgi:AcrR family transcriptional regulator
MTEMVEGIAPERRPPFGERPAVGPRGAKTQRRILLAALEVFAEHGYHDSSVEQITAAAGCSRPSFYQYFSSREDVFRALAAFVGRSVAEMTERVGPITPDAAGRAALVAWMREFAAFYDEYAPVFTGFSAAVRSDTGLADASAAVNAGLGKALSPRLALDGDVDQEVVARIVVTMIVRANLLRRAVSGLVGRERFVGSLADVLHRVLLGPALDPVGGDDPADGDGRGSTAVPAPRAAGRASARRAGPGGPEPDGAAAQRALSPQGERMRARIIEAGRAVFPRRGFHETRIDDVVEAAGASHGSFYRYFASKEDLFQAIAADAATRLLAGLQAFPADGGDAEALRTWLHGWFDLYAAHGGIIAIWRETQFPGHELEDLSRDVAKGALDVLLQAVGDRAVGDPLVDAMALLGLVETVPHHVHAFGYFSQATAVEALVVIIRRGFLAG